MRRLFPIGVVGSVIAALCCVGVLTPLLVAGLGCPRTWDTDA